jgi:PAS domain S-box-containing protein
VTSNPVRPPDPNDPDDDNARREYASPVCYAHEFESVWAARAAAAPPELHRLIVEQAAEAVVFADRGGTIRLWNRGAERLFGHGASEALGASLDLIVPERFRAAHDQGFRRAIESGALRSADAVRVTRSQHKDGRKLYVEMSFNLVRDGAGKVLGAFAVARDVTERHLNKAAR